ncbi:unnamed protein product [Camellia sinensis]
MPHNPSTRNPPSQLSPPYFLSLSASNPDWSFPAFWKLDSHIRAPFLEVLKMGKFKGEEEECTLDGSVDLQGQPAIRERTGKWVAGIIIL